MECSTCGSPAVVFDVPERERAYTPEEAATAAICTSCLAVEPAPESVGDADPDSQDDESDLDDADDPDFSSVSAAFPSSPDQAVPLALALGKCNSIATNRGQIETLLRRVERAGGDPLLILDRLLGDPSLEPAIDLERRRHQLEQLLY